MERKYEKLYRSMNVTPTKQRVDLANIIFSKKQHFTASDLITLADKNKLNISMATVYNTLSLLEDKGMLKTININNELKFYDTNLEHHHHLYNTHHQYIPHKVHSPHRYYNSFPIHHQ